MLHITFIESECVQVTAGRPGDVKVRPWVHYLVGEGTVLRTYQGQNTVCPFLAPSVSDRDFGEESSLCVVKIVV